MSAEIRPAPRIARPPIHPLVVCFPIACLSGALLTDLAYWRTAEMLWTDFSAWLISAGVILGWIAAIAAAVDLFGHRYGIRARPWAYALGNLVALLLATVNMLVHTRDAWTSVVPWGLALSAATVVVMALTMWIGWAALYRREWAVLP